MARMARYSRYVVGLRGNKLNACELREAPAFTVLRVWKAFPEDAADDRLHNYVFQTGDAVRFTVGRKTEALRICFQLDTLEVMYLRERELVEPQETSQETRGEFLRKAVLLYDADPRILRPQGSLRCSLPQSVIPVSC